MPSSSKSDDRRPIGENSDIEGGSFWRDKALADLTAAEWEALCDGCARCCLMKLEDIDTGEIAWTNVACRLLDPAACRCRNYADRRSIVPDCIPLTPEAATSLSWLPATCAYRLRAEGRPLPDWHPLVSGDPESVRRAGVSVAGRIVGEDEVHPDDLEDFVVDWPAKWPKSAGKMSAVEKNPK